MSSLRGVGRSFFLRGIPYTSDRLSSAARIALHGGLDRQTVQAQLRPRHGSSDFPPYFTLAWFRYLQLVTQRYRMTLNIFKDQLSHSARLSAIRAKYNTPSRPPSPRSHRLETRPTEPCPLRRVTSPRGPPKKGGTDRSRIRLARRINARQRVYARNPAEPADSLPLFFALSLSRITRCTMKEHSAAKGRNEEGAEAPELETGRATLPVPPSSRLSPLKAVA